MPLTSTSTVLGLVFLSVRAFAFFTRASLFALRSFLVFCVFPLCCYLVVSTSAINCLKRLVSEMNYYVSSGMLNPTIPIHSVTRTNIKIMVTLVTISDKWQLTWIFSKTYVSLWLVSFKRKQHIVNFTCFIAAKHFPQIFDTSVCRKTFDKDTISHCHPLQHIHRIISAQLRDEYPQNL